MEFLREGSRYGLIDDSVGRLARLVALRFRNHLCHLLCKIINPRARRFEVEMARPTGGRSQVRPALHECASSFLEQLAEGSSFCPTVRACAMKQQRKEWGAFGKQPTPATPNVTDGDCGN